MATRRADDRPKRDIPDGDDEVPLDASALMEHLRDMETKLNLVCAEFSVRVRVALEYFAILVSCGPAPRGSLMFPTAFDYAKGFLLRGQPYRR
jgi:hypothetical protein